MAAASSKQSKKVQSTPNGHANAAPLVNVPPVAEGFVRLPVDPIWWSGEGELHGALIDVEMTSAPNGKAVNALVIVATMQTTGIDNWGDRSTVAAYEPVRLDEPLLLKFAGLASDPEQVPQVILRYVMDRGRRRLIADFSKERIPRTKLMPPQQRPVASNGAAAPPS